MAHKKSPHGGGAGGGRRGGGVAGLGQGRRKTLSDSEVLAYSRNRFAETTLQQRVLRLSDEEHVLHERHQREVRQWRDFRRHSLRTSGTWGDSGVDSQWPPPPGDYPISSGDGDPESSPPSPRRATSADVSVAAAEMARSLAFPNEALSQLQQPWAYSFSVSSHNTVYRQAWHRAQGQRTRLYLRRASFIPSSCSSPSSPRLHRQDFFRSRSSVGDAIQCCATRPMTGRSTPGLSLRRSGSRDKQTASPVVLKTRPNTSAGMSGPTDGQRAVTPPQTMEVRPGQADSHSTYDDKIGDKNFLPDSGSVSKLLFSTIGDDRGSILETPQTHTTTSSQNIQNASSTILRTKHEVLSDENPNFPKTKRSSLTQGKTDCELLNTEACPVIHDPAQTHVQRATDGRRDSVESGVIETIHRDGFDHSDHHHNTIYSTHTDTYSPDTGLEWTDTRTADTAQSTHTGAIETDQSVKTQTHSTDKGAQLTDTGENPADTQSTNTGTRSTETDKTVKIQTYPADKVTQLTDTGTKRVDEQSSISETDQIVKTQTHATGKGIQSRNTGKNSAETDSSVKTQTHATGKGIQSRNTGTNSAETDSSVKSQTHPTGKGIQSRNTGTNSAETDSSVKSQTHPTGKGVISTNAADTNKKVKLGTQAAAKRHNDQPSSDITVDGTGSGKAASLPLPPQSQNKSAREGTPSSGGVKWVIAPHHHHHPPTATDTAAPPRTPRQQGGQVGAVEEDSKRSTSLPSDVNKRRSSDCGALGPRSDMTPATGRTGSGFLSRRYSALDVVCRRGSLKDQVRAERAGDRQRLIRIDTSNEGATVHHPNEATGSPNETNANLTSATKLTAKDTEMARSLKRCPNFSAITAVSSTPRTGKVPMLPVDRRDCDNRNPVNPASPTTVDGATPHFPKTTHVSQDRRRCERQATANLHASMAEATSAAAAAADPRPELSPQSESELVDLLPSDRSSSSDSDYTVFKGVRIRHYVRPQHRYRASTSHTTRRDMTRLSMESPGPVCVNGERGVGKADMIFPKTSRRKILKELVDRHNQPFRAPDKGVVPPELRAKIDEFFKTIEPYCPKPEVVLD